MQNAGIDKTYIVDCIGELTELLPVKPSAPASEYYSFLRSGRVRECVEAIAIYLNLPIKINLVYVSPDDRSATQFQSRDLVTTDQQGQARDSITAQVMIPAMLPLYGSDEFRELTFTVKVSRSCADSPRVFVAIMAHELTHVVLHSLWYTDKDNEVKTDLAAMLLGFRDAMRDGRKLIKDETPFVTVSDYRVTSTTTYGYLSDELFDYAHNEINRLYRNGQKMLAGLARDIADVQSALNHLGKQMRVFQKALELIDKRSIAHTDPNDGLRLVSFHDVGFLDRFKTSAASIKSHCDAIDLRHLRPHSKDGAALIQRTEESLRASRIECQQLIAAIAKDNRVITKYLGPVYKMLLLFTGGTWLPGLEKQGCQ